MKQMFGEQVLVRTYSAGVHVGILESIENKNVLLSNARRVWAWTGANTLNELATKGPGQGSKISEVVEQILLTEAIEVMLAPAKFGGQW